MLGERATINTSDPDTRPMKRAGGRLIAATHKLLKLWRAGLAASGTGMPPSKAA